jgi:hypothetical protein
MFPKSLIDSLKDCNEPYFQKLITKQNFEEWKQSLRSTMFESRLKDIEEVLEIRDTCEDILESEFYITKPFNLPKEINKVSNRTAIASAALHNHIIQYSIPKEPWPSAYIDYILAKEAKGWLDLTDPKITIRPRFKLSREELDDLISTIEKQFAVCNKTWVKMWSIKLGFPDSIVPVLGILYAIANELDLDDLFIDCPKSQVLGAPCNYREIVDSETISLKTKTQTVDYSTLAVAANGSLFMYTTKQWHRFTEPLANYIAWVPGLELNVQIEQGPAVRRYLMVAKGSLAGILAVTYGPNGLVLVSKKAEFDLNEDIDYFDCQRDRDNNIILLFGQFNHNIGSLKGINYCGWTEEEFIQRKEGTIEPKKLLNRTSGNARVDFRDHGNLLALVSNITEKNETERQFFFEQSIHFGSYVVPMQFEKRLYAVYGSPVHFIVISGNQIIECTKPISGQSQLSILPIDLPVAPKAITSLGVIYN